MVNSQGVSAMIHVLGVNTDHAADVYKWLLKFHQICKNGQNSGISWLYLESSWEIDPNKYKHAYWFSKYWHFSCHRCAGIAWLYLEAPWVLDPNKHASCWLVGSPICEIYFWNWILRNAMAACKVLRSCEEIDILVRGQGDPWLIAIVLKCNNVIIHQIRDGSTHWFWGCKCLKWRIFLDMVDGMLKRSKDKG